MLPCVSGPLHHHHTAHRDGDLFGTCALNSIDDETSLKRNVPFSSRLTRKSWLTSFAFSLNI